MNADNFYLIDTDIIFYWLNNKSIILNSKIEAVEDRIVLSSITMAELYYGAYNSSKPSQNIQLIHDLGNELEIIPFDHKAAERFGRIKITLKEKGEIVNDSDLFIASIALSRGLTLVTNNERHFSRIEGLLFENWTK
jgi:tRNA(fMet)-specific endonuclease VapC